MLQLSVQCPFVMWLLDLMECVIDKCAVTRSCGLDQLTEERVKYASYRITVLLALCFSGLVMHDILPDYVLSLISAICQGQNWKNIKRRILQIMIPGSHHPR